MELSSLAEMYRAHPSAFVLKQGDTTIEYNPLKYFGEPGFLEEQLKNHQTQLTKLKTEIIPNNYKQLYSKIEKTRDLERILEYIPEELARSMVKIIIPLINLSTFITEGTTLKKMFDSLSDSMNQDVQRYELIRLMMDTEREFYEGRLSENQGDPALKSQLEEMVFLTKEMGIAYTRLISTTNHFLEDDERIRKIIGI